MAEKPSITKTDPAEIASRQKWQDEVANQLSSDSISSANLVDQMQNSFGKSDQFYSTMVKGSDISNKLLHKVESNSLQTATILEGFTDFMKDAERKRLENAMEAARKGDKSKGLATAGKIPGKDEDDEGPGIGTALAVGGLAAAALAFKDKWGSLFSSSTKTLSEMDAPKAGFFSKMKSWMGFGDDTKKIKDLSKVKSGMFFNLKKYFGMEQKWDSELTKRKAGFVDDFKNFFKFKNVDHVKLHKDFGKGFNQMMSWSTDTTKMTAAAKSDFFNKQKEMLKWLDDDTNMSLKQKKAFVAKQAKMLRWAAEHTDGMDKSKVQFLKNQSKMLTWADDASDAAKAKKLKFLQKHGDVLDISDDVLKKSKLSKDQFIAKQLKMMGLNKADVDNLQLKKQGMFSKMKTKVFNIGDDVIEGFAKTKAGFSSKFGKFLSFPAVEEGGKLMEYKKGFGIAMDNMLGTLLKVTKGFFKLVNVMSFGAMGFLNAEALAKPTKTFQDLKATVGKAFGPEGGVTKIAKTFKSILSPLTDTLKPLGGILKTVGKIAKVVGKIFLPIAAIFAVFDVVSNVIDGYKEGGITGAIGAGIESIFDDIIFAIPNLLGEAVAWILKKFNFNNAVEWIDKNLRDKDGNFSLFTGIKKLFSMIGDVIGELWAKIQNFMSFDNIMSLIGSKLIKSGTMGKGAAKLLLNDKYEQMAEMRANMGEAKWQAMKDKERKQADLKAQKEAAVQAGTANLQAIDNSAINTNAITISAPNASKLGADPMGRKK